MGPSPPALPNPQLCPSFSPSLGAGKWFQAGKAHVFGEASLSHLFRSLLWLSRHLCSETCTPSLLSHLSHTHVHPGAPHPHPGHMLRVSRSGSPVGTQGVRDSKVNTLGWFQEDAVMGFQSCPLSTSIHHHSLTIIGWHPHPVGCFGDMASWSCPSFTALGFLVFEGPSCPGDPHPPGLWFFFLCTLLHLSLNICWKLWWGLEDPEHALEMGSCAPLLLGQGVVAQSWLWLNCGSILFRLSCPWPGFKFQPTLPACWREWSVLALVPQEAVGRAHPRGTDPLLCALRPLSAVRNCTLGAQHFTPKDEAPR